jgi:hypothetical protein
MSQIYVERVIGLLVTDECIRGRFTRDPRAALEKLIEGGMELTPGELRSLMALDPDELARFVEAVDPRLQKTDLQAFGPEDSIRCRWRNGGVQ